MGRDLASDSDRNLEATWRHLGHHAGRVEEDDDVLAVETGSSIPTFNPVFVRHVPRDAAALVRRVVDRSVPVVVTANPAIADIDRLVAAATETGLVQRPRLPGMALAGLADLADLESRGTDTAVEIEPPLAIETVATSARWRTYFDVICRGFGVPQELVGRLTDPAIYEFDHIAGFLGFVGAKAVTTSLAYLEGDTVGIYNVATLPAHRRRGLGEAMTWAACEWGRQHGAEVAVLQASEMGYPIYERMGFREVVPYVQLVVPA